MITIFLVEGGMVSEMSIQRVASPVLLEELLLLLSHQADEDIRKDFLHLLYSGPRQDTPTITDEIQKTLHVDGIQRRSLLICDTSFKVRHRYQKAIGHLLSIRKVNFSRPSAVLKLLKRETRFRDLFTEEQIRGEVLVMSTLRFKAPWVAGFDPDLTQPAKFIRSDVEMMYQHTKVSVYCEDGVTAILKRFENGAQIELVMGLPYGTEFVRRIPYREADIHLYIPKCKIDQTHDLKRLLPECDYRHINPQGCTPAEIRQRVCIELDEEGDLVPVEPHYYDYEYECECSEESDDEIVFNRPFHFRLTIGEYVIASGLYNGEA